MVPPVDRDTVLWTLVVFFGASILFAAIRNATEGEGAGVSLAASARGGAAARGGDRRLHEEARPRGAVTRWIVDGMNVIGSRPTGWWRDRPGAMRELVEELEAFAERSGEPVTVVLDGKPFDLEGGDAWTCGSPRAAGRNAADDDIAALVESDDDPADLSVVTSDADLARRVREAGATVVGAGEFRRLLDG